MLASESLRFKDGHAPVPGCPLELSTHKHVNTFGAFLDEFTGGSWVSFADSCSDCRSTSFTCTNGEEDDCQSSRVPETLTEERCFSKPRRTINVLDSQVDAQHPSLKLNNTEEQPSSPTSRNDGDSLQQLHPRPYEKTESASGTPKETSVDGDKAKSSDAVARTLAHSCFRTLTNTTYLRRMHMGKEDAIGLFPKVRKTIEHTFAADTKQSISLGPIKIATSVFLQDGKGRRWPVVLECLRTAGQRHIRINRGWGAVCVANRLTVGKCIRLERWEKLAQGEEEEEEASVVRLKIE